MSAHHDFDTYVIGKGCSPTEGWLLTFNKTGMSTLKFRVVRADYLVGFSLMKYCYDELYQLYEVAVKPKMS